PFFVFFTFVLVAAAYRWEFRETVGTGIILGFLFISQGMLFAGDGYEVNRFIMRSAYLLITSILLGYLARADKRLKAETGVLASGMGKGEAERGLSQTLEAVLEELRRFYSGSSVILAVAENLSGRAYRVLYEPASGRIPKIDLSEMDSSGRATYLFDSAA